MTPTPSAEYLARLAAPLLDSSSGCACTAINRSEAAAAAAARRWAPCARSESSTVVLIKDSLTVLLFLPTQASHLSSVFIVPRLRTGIDPVVRTRKIPGRPSGGGGRLTAQGDRPPRLSDRPIPAGDGTLRGKMEANQAAPWGPSDVFSGVCRTDREPACSIRTRTSAAVPGWTRIAISRARSTAVSLHRFHSHPHKSSWPRRTSSKELP